DHLALLPDKVGACSIADGAGFIRNQKAHEKRGLLRALNSVLVKMGLVGNEASHNLIRERLSIALREKFSIDGDKGPFLWVEDVYSNFVIFEYDGKLYRINYTSNDAKVTLDGDPVEVVRVTEYRTLEGTIVAN